MLAAPLPSKLLLKLVIRKPSWVRPLSASTCPGSTSPGGTTTPSRNPAIPSRSTATSSTRTLTPHSTDPFSTSSSSQGRCGNNLKSFCSGRYNSLRTTFSDSGQSLGETRPSLLRNLLQFRARSEPKALLSSLDSAMPVPDGDCLQKV
ncbi:hypothetical protein N658DRAFT_256325 [Parathielavia hyrcaniae]|uniref:Uncharacterized protein n=1 Tax=Parathielavia hyrcaniae TaxID=113614 RepID=A0AAN6PXK2_9PEZI|nr:hypothetical protein N658DRAFT_256325 [Parathielavia hyrcaniae]